MYKQKAHHEPKNFSFLFTLCTLSGICVYVYFLCVFMFTCVGAYAYGGSGRSALSVATHAIYLVFGDMVILQPRTQ